MRRRARIGAGLALAAIVAGYACQPERQTRVYLEDFEGELCDGVPCGWERSTGTPAQARWVETIHPGEHALQLEGDVTVRGPGAFDTIRGPRMLLRFVVRCDPGSRLGLDVLVSDGLGTRALGVAAFAPPEWDEVSVTLGGGGEIADSRISAVVLTKTGPGVCEIAEIVMDDLRFEDDLTC
ncbi:MAG: hypothetical protein KF729_33455 [Sandaracinaceae bacterium]|nr:hypothetical protein [Sandaracinaceae bacterium]